MTNFRLLLAVIVFAISPFASCQTPAHAAPSIDERAAAGSQPDDPGPLATDLFPRFKHRDILRAMKKVADWQLVDAEGKYNIQWTYAALYDGFLAASKASGDQRYRDRVLQVAEQNHWSLGPRFGHADDEAIGLTYLSFYAEKPDPEMLAPTRDGMDKVLARPDDAQNLLWWWCDALYMAAPVLAQLSQVTGDPRYVDFMDHEWTLTKAVLYDSAERLYYRDKRFVTMHEPNGQKVFWSRGNGWILAGLALVIQQLDVDSPLRTNYVALYRAMAGRIAALQPSDGLWRASLLDPDAYPAPEISSTAFFTYAIAWAINQHILDRKKYLPVVRRAWRGMLSHIYASGRLGDIQPIGAEPGKYLPSSSYVYGVGAFLMAGSELCQITGGAKRSGHSAK
ncbi:MAG TPA: glycoside hydrolase family 88 protein [Candidatus Binatia bacterium]|nr:glycoside hydrolase family 88 protein [Candidatus Binatia bacterium]